MPSGSDAVMLGRTLLRPPCETSSGLAVACLMTPSAMAGLPLKRTMRRSSSGAELGVADIGEAHEIAVGVLER